jgi:ABC-type transport system involved in cytochrome c biogenesis permease subunit
MKLSQRKAFPYGAVLSLLFLGALWAGGMPFYFQDVAALLRAGSGLEGSYRLATAFNTLLAVSTALYVANLWLESARMGRIASLFAALGALGLLLDVALRVLWPDISGRVVGGVDSAEYEAVALWVALATLGWVAAERMFRIPSVGAFVMPVIMCGVVTEIWLINAGTAGSGLAVFSGLAAYWGQAFVLAHFIGYGAFLLAAGLGVLYLLFREWAPADGRRFAERWWLYEMMVAALSVGLPVFAVAAFMLLGHWLDARSGLGGNAWVALVLGIYGILFWLLYRRPLAGERLAWGSILGFGATLMGYIALHLLPGGAAPVA